MNYYALLPIIALFTIIHLTIKIILKNKNKTNLISLFLFYLNAILWLLMETLNWLITDPFFTLLRLKITSIFWISAGFWFMNFVFDFVNIKKNIIYHLILIFTLMVTILSLFTNLMISGYNKYYWGTGIKPGLLYIVLGSSVNIFPVIYSIFILISALFKKENEKIKKQIILLSIGTILTLIAGYTTDLILPFILNNENIIQIGVLTIIIPSTFIYLIKKKKDHITVRFDNFVNNLFNDIEDGIIVIYENGSIGQINNSAVLMFDLDKNDLEDLKIYHLIPDYDYYKMYHNFELNPNLHRKYITISQFDIIIDKTVIGKILIIRDITEQKVLNVIWKRYEFIVDTVKDFMMLVDKNYRFIIVNKSLCNMINKKQKEMINQHVSAIWGEKLFNKIMKEHIDRCFNGEFVKYKNWFNFGNNEKKYLELLYFPYYNYNQEITHAVIIGHDLTEIKLGENIIQQSHLELEKKISERTSELEDINKSLLEEIKQRINAEDKILNVSSRIQQLISSINSIIIGISIDLKIIYFNPTAESVLNLKESEIIGKNINDLNINWDLKIILDNIKICFNEKTNIRLDLLSYKTKEGKNRILGLNINPILNRNNTFDGFLIWGADITERKSLEVQLAQSQKLESIGQLAAGIAHEINTPIQYIGDNLHFFENAFKDIDLIIKKYQNVISEIKSENSNVKEIMDVEKKIDILFLLNEIPKAVTQSLEGIDRVSKIVKSMRDFSHPGVTEKTQCDINHSLESTITISKNEWKYIADLKTNFDQSIPAINCNQGEINQVFLNIIINAAHAIEDLKDKNPDAKGLIEISTSKADNYVQIKISDSGCGIPDNIKDKIFDHFFTTKEVGRGTGQGLAISYAIVVEKHKGILTFDSEAGKGTTFIIKLPI